MIRLENVSFRYERREHATVKSISLDIKPGERVLLAGRTGCGKSTLLKIMNGLIPTCSKGEFSGRAYLDGRESVRYSPAQLGAIIGTVYQNPDDQLFAMTVGDEVAFALENQGLPQNEISVRVEETLCKAGLSGMAERNIRALSGGQKQRLALASALVTRPKALILDEPISQLNPQAVKSFLDFLLELNRDYGIMLIVVEHRVHELAAFFPRLCLMNEGRLIYDGETEKVWGFIDRVGFLGLREPQCVTLCRRLGIKPPLADTGLLAERLKAGLQGRYQAHAPIMRCCVKSNELALKTDGVFFTYPGGREAALKNVSFEIHKGEAVAVMGNNGAGKSTLLNLLPGLEQPETGKIELLGGSVRKNMHKVAYLRQEPDLMLLCQSVREEIAFGPGKTCACVENTAIKLGLFSLMDDYPLALSKGQRLRVILAALLASRPEILLLDEPTTGQDCQSMLDIKNMLDFYRKNDGTVLFCTHDTELAAEIADRVLLFEAGSLLKDGTTREILTDDELVRRGGLNPLPMLTLSRLIGCSPMLDVEEVASHVSAAVVGRG